jgi:transposase
MPNPLPPEKHAEIFAALHANSNSMAVAKRSGVNQATVWKIGKREGIELTAGKTAKRRAAAVIPSEKHTQIIEALQANPNASAVARQIGGVSFQTVCSIAKKTGIELTAGKAMGGKPAMIAEKRAQVIEALQANPNASAVARQIGGIGFTTVLRIAKQEGVELAAAGRPARRDDSVQSRPSRSRGSKPAI